MIFRINRYWVLSTGWLKVDRFLGFQFTWYDGPHYIVGFWFFVVALSLWWD